MKVTAAFYELKILERRQIELFELRTILENMDEFQENEYSGRYIGLLKELEKDADTRIRTLFGALETLEIDV